MPLTCFLKGDKAEMENFTKPNVAATAKSY